MTIPVRQGLRRGSWLFVLGLFVLGLFVFPLVAEPRFPNQDAEAAARKGDAHAAKGEWATALAEYRNAVALDPKKAGYRARLGAALSETGKSDEALVELLEGLRLDPASSLTYRSLGDHFLGLMQWKAAEASYSKAVELSAGDPKARHGLGIALTAQEKLDEAAAAFSEAVRLAPANPEHPYWLGDVQFRQKKWKESEASVRLALEKSVDAAFEVRCVNSLGDLFFAQKRWANAEREFRKAASLDPKDGRSLANLAAALYRRGAREEAWRTAHRALRLGYVGPHEIYTELGIDRQPVVPLVPVIRRHRGLHPSDSDLLAAVGSLDIAAVRAALAAGANPEARMSTKRAIEIAAAAGDAATIKALLDHGASGDAAPSGGGTPLILAVRSGSLNAVVALLGAGVDTECGPQGSALLAATEGLSDDLSVGIVSALVQAGAEVNVRHTRTGLTPLMWAARSDSIELPKLLIEAGADARVQDLTRQTALDHARNMGKDDTARFLVPFVSSAAPNAPGDAIRLAPGGDLLQASRGARSGQTIVLVAGKYSGPIDVQGKTLTIIGDSDGGTVIVAHPGGEPRLFERADPYVFVGKGGNLDLWNVRFDESPASNSVVSIRDGALLRLGSCVFENLTKTACIAKKEARLFVSDCRFENLTGSPAIALYESTGVVWGTQFKDLEGTCLQASNGSTLSAVRSVFTRAKAGAAGFSKSALRISHCRFTGVARGVTGTEARLVSLRDSQFANGSLAVVHKSAGCVLRRNTARNAKIAPESKAIYVQNSRGVLIADNQIAGVKSAIQVKDSAGEPVAVSRNTLRRTHWAIAVEGTSQGERPFALITGNRILGGHPDPRQRWQYGLFLDGEMHAVVAGNTILQRYGSAVLIQANATAWLVGNLLSSIDGAIRFHEASARKTTLIRDLLYGEVKTYRSGTGPVRRSATEKLDTFVRWSPRAERLEHVIGATPKSADLADNDLRAFLSTVEKERDAAFREASRYGTVRLEVRDRVGRSRTVPFRANDRRSPPRGIITFTLDQVVDAGWLARRWKAEDLDAIEDPIERLMERAESTDKVLVYLRNNAHRTTRTIVAAYDVGSEPSKMLVLSIVAELNRFLNSREFADDPTSKEDEEVARVNGCIMDRERIYDEKLTAEEKGTRIREFNRKLLEHVFRFGIAQSNPLLLTRTAAGLPSGAYVLESGEFAGLSTEVAFGPALDVTAQLAVNDGLWVTYSWGEPEMLRLRPRYQMQRAIGRLRFEWWRSGFAMRRANADSAWVAYALDLVRRTLAVSERERPLAHFGLPAQILSAVGEAGDAKRILEASRRAADEANPWTFPQKLDWAAVIGRIDAAGGRLADGNLTALLADGNRDWAVAAAIELHRNGVGTGDDLLRDELSKGTGFLRSAPAGRVLLDSHDPRTLEAMRGLWDRMIREEGLESDSWKKENSSLAPCLYLLAFGNPDDWERISRFTLLHSHVEYLTLLARDPRGLMRRAAANLLPESSPTFYRLAESFLDRTRGEFKQLQSDFDRTSSSIIFDFRPNTPRGGPYNSSRAYMSPFWPSSTAAVLYTQLGGRRSGLTKAPRPLTWWKKKSFLPEYVTRWIQSQDYRDHLSYFSPEEIAQEVSRRGQRPAEYDLYMAYLQVATREHTYPSLRSPGFASRPYVAVDGGSAVSGVADLRFNRKSIPGPSSPPGDLGPPEPLEIGVRITQAGIGIPEAYIVNRGREMIQSVTLRRADKKIQAEATGKADDDSFFLFEGLIETHDLSGWYLDVEMKFVNHEFTLTTPLFFGENARRLRMAAARSGEEGGREQ